MRNKIVIHELEEARYVTVDVVPCDVCKNASWYHVEISLVNTFLCPKCLFGLYDTIHSVLMEYMSNTESFTEE